MRRVGRKETADPTARRGRALHCATLCRKTFPGKVRGTADPSASPDFLSRVAASVSCVWFSLERTTSVVAGESSEAGNPGTLGMTKRRGSLGGKGLLPKDRA